MSDKLLIIGKKALIDAAYQKRLIKATISNKDKQLASILKKAKAIVDFVDDKEFYQKITNNANHQFAIGYVNSNAKILDLKKYIEEEASDRELIIILDSIEDPHNFGAIIRSAEALGARAIIYKKDNQCPINETVIKVSAGAVANIFLIQVVNINESIRQLKENGFWIYASCLQEDAHNASEIKYDKKTALILGNEDKGISNLVIKNSDFKIYIPMKGKTQSLNVSVAAGIFINLIIKSQERLK